MSSKITIIGAGNVGSTIAYTLAHDDIASELVMIDINKDKVEGEVLDIIQGMSFRDPISIIAGDYEDAKDSDIVIITSGIGRKPGQSRLDLAQTNVNIMKELAPKIAAVAPNALYVIVSNPVDVMTYVFMKVSGIPENQVIGSGTILDTARLRCGISEHFEVAQKNVHAYVFGEHGDSSFVPWSCANISNVPVEDYAKAIKTTIKYPEFNKEEILNYVRKSGGRVIQRKGATFYAVSMSVCHLCKCILSGVDTTLTVSTMMNGEYGIEDVCLSVLNVVDEKGAHSKVMVPLTDEELEALHNSANVLKDLIKNLDI